MTESIGSNFENESSNLGDVIDNNHPFIERIRGLPHRRSRLLNLFFEYCGADSDRTKDRICHLLINRSKKIKFRDVGVARGENFELFRRKLIDSEVINTICEIESEVFESIRSESLSRVLDLNEELKTLTGKIDLQSITQIENFVSKQVP